MSNLKQLYYVLLWYFPIIFIIPSHLQIILYILFFSIIILLISIHFKIHKYYAVIGWTSRRLWQILGLAAAHSIVATVQITNSFELYLLV